MARGLDFSLKLGMHARERQRVPQNIRAAKKCRNPPNLFI
jgi:hypothetical protein